MAQPRQLAQREARLARVVAEEEAVARQPGRAEVRLAQQDASEDRWRKFRT
jgi:hypothetical protein